VDEFSMGSETMAEQTGWLAAFALFVWTMIGELHPGAAMGASFGCVFFIFLPDPTVGGMCFRFVRKLGLAIVSWGFGYATGIAVGSAVAMLAAIIGSALAAAVLGALNLMVLNDGDLPHWLATLIRAVLRLKPGGRDEP
jgi:hypothetical protein